MNGSQSGGEEHKSADWAPFDYTDGKKKGQWKTEYPSKALWHMAIETLYLVLLAGSCLYGVFWVLHKSDQRLSNLNHDAVQFSQAYLGFLGALFAGTLGGCSFGVKCMYHFAAKQMWHEDRRLWRLLTPPLSGILSLFMVFLVASGLLEIFDSTFIEHPVRVMAFSFLVGYFSDKALAKMADVADTLFGETKK